MCHTIIDKRAVLATRDDIDINTVAKSLSHPSSVWRHVIDCSHCCKDFIKSLISMTSCQNYNLYDVISNLLIYMTSCHIKNIYLRYMLYNKVYMICFFQYHKPYQPSTMFWVNTDAILKKPYDILYLYHSCNRVIAVQTNIIASSGLI